MIGVVLLVGCLAGASLVGSRAMRDATPPATRGLSAPGLSAPLSSPSATASTPASGPQASTTPVREESDLEQLCEQVYYPKSPKVKSSGIQPVSIFVRDSKDFDNRTAATLFNIPNWYTKQKQKAWDPEQPSKVRLVACVDLTTTGKKTIKSCKFDDPKGLKIPMREGTYHVRLFEVATGKKLMDKQVRGADRECPFAVLLGEDRTIYSKVGDRRLYDLFKKYVEK